MANDDLSLSDTNLGKALDQPAPTIQYINRPECAETFADSISRIYFDGQSLRIELAVTRLDEPRDGKITGQRITAARLVLTPGTALELLNRLQQIANHVLEAGKPKSGPAK